MQLGPNPTFDPMGLASNGNSWINSNAPMTFRKRNERIDWRKIASIDLERISRELDFDTLQDNIANVAFCNIECELDPRCCDPNYIKLFRLAQLIIEYLLHSQDYLSHTVVALEEKCRFLTSQLDCERNTKCGTDDLVKKLKDEVKKYKKLLCLSKNSTMQQTAECHACPLCPKIFVTAEYLQMHMKRRHFDQAETQNQVAIVVEKLEKEVYLLKEQLQLTQNQLQDERKAKTGDDIQMWKVQQLEAQKKEIEAIRDLFMKEMHEINNRTTFAEYCVNNLQKELHDVCNSPPPSPPCAIPMIAPIKDENCELLKGQKKEFCKLRKSLTQHVEDIVCLRLKAHEDTLQKRIKCLAKEQTHELEKLNCLVQEKFGKPDKNETENLLHDLCERTKEQERRLKKQQRKIEELLCTQTLQVPEPKPEPKPCTKSRKARRYICRPHCYPYHHLHCRPLKSKYMLGIRDSDVNSNDSLQSPYHTRQLDALKKNQSLVEGLREEFSCMLQEKLDNMGIPTKQPNISNMMTNRKSVTIQPRSRSWSGGYDIEEEDEEESESGESEETIEPVKNNNKRVLPRSPSLPIQSIASKESNGEWQRKIPKQSRLSSTKESFSKLVSSVKKKLKPGKFWQSHSTPVKGKKQIENAQITLKESTSNTSAVTIQPEIHIEYAESEDESEEEESEEEEESKTDKNENGIKLEAKTTHRNLNIDEMSDNQIKSIKNDDNSSEWASSSSELEEIEKTPQKPAQTTARLFTILPQKANKNPISETAKNLETKLTGIRTKPFGGVDAVNLNKNKTNSLEDFDSSLSSEKESRPQRMNPKQKPPRNERKDEKKMTEKKTVKSMYDWDSEDDISEIT